METITPIKRGLIFKMLVICLQKEYPKFPTAYMNITAQFQVKSFSIWYVLFNSYFKVSFYLCSSMYVCKYIHVFSRKCLQV